jgi:hypothetical protein
LKARSHAAPPARRPRPPNGSSRPGRAAAQGSARYERSVRPGGSADRAARAAGRVPCASASTTPRRLHVSLSSRLPALGDPQDALGCDQRNAPLLAAEITDQTPPAHEARSAQMSSSIFAAWGCQSSARRGPRPAVTQVQDRPDGVIEPRPRRPPPARAFLTKRPGCVARFRQQLVTESLASLSTRRRLRHPKRLSQHAHPRATTMSSTAPNSVSAASPYSAVGAWASAAVLSCLDGLLGQEVRERDGRR